jgi:hypothetical protein
MRHLVGYDHFMFALAAEQYECACAAGDTIRAVSEYGTKALFTPFFGGFYIVGKQCNGVELRLSASFQLYAAPFGSAGAEGCCC